MGLLKSVVTFSFAHVFQVQIGIWGDLSRLSRPAFSADEGQSLV